ncbi:MAG TPA: MFS transporter [Saprospiraceae bacterium]|nr:MFS transporter [Saprospiraceae bacterium]
MALNDKKTIKGWVFYDWANSAYYLVISTAIFPIYFSNRTHPEVKVLGQSISNTALYSFSVSAAYILITFLSPVLSGIADYAGRRMFFLRLFTIIGAAGCCTLFFFTSPETMWIGTAGFILGTIGGAGGLVFYDSYLPLIATEDQYDKVSARGYSYGYIGSVLLLIFCLVMIQKPEWFGISNPTLPPRISFVLVGVWWLGFSQITFHHLPKDNPIASATKVLARGWHELALVWQLIKHDTQIKRYLSSYFFYMAGVQTTIYLASLFADRVLGFKDSELIITILLLQLVAIPGALFFAGLSKRKGNKLSLLIQLGIWVLICFGAYITTSKWQFFTIAAMVGLVLGGIQSLSRSTYAKLLENRTSDLTSFFSFYDVLSKVAIVSGTFLFGLVNSITGSMRFSVLILAVFFVIGFIFLTTVDKHRLNTEVS